MTGSATVRAYRLGMDDYRIRALDSQALELRELLEALAREREQLGASEPDRARVQALLRRAMRIRARLHGL